MAATLLLERCDPYGAESGGPRRVMGGLHGPGSAATPGADLPENVAQGEWLCQQQAQVRVKMVCRCGHEGRVMALCSWHDELVTHGEMVGGTTRKVTSIIRQHGHFEEIQKRQAGACMRCAYPARDGYDFAADYKSIMAWQDELHYLFELGAWYSARAASVRATIEGIVARFDEGIERGIIHQCPMQLIQIS